MGKRDDQSQNKLLLEVKHLLRSLHQIRLPHQKQWLKKKKILSMPWILLLGPSASGKTSLLSQSDFALYSPLQRKLEDKLPTPTIDWWLAPEGIFIEAGGSITFQNKGQDHFNDWQHTLSLLKHFRRRAPIDAIILTLDLPTLITADPEEWHTFTNHLHHNLEMLKQSCAETPITLLITHMDKLEGFAAFFSDLSKEERTEPCGFSLTAYNPSQGTYLDHFNMEFQQFVQLLNHRALWKLQHEPHHHRRTQILAFLLQLEKLGDHLSKWMHTFPAHVAPRLQGVYFASTKQNNESLNLIAHQIEKTLQLQLPPPPAQPQQHHPLFIHGLLAQLVQTHQKSHARPPVPAWLTWTIFPLTGCLILASVSLFHFNYQDNAQWLQKVQTQLTSQSGEETWLMHLTQLETLLSDPRLHAPRSSPLFQGAQDTFFAIQQAFSKLIEQRLLPFVEKTASRALENSLQEDSAHLYLSLQAYLMLNDPKHQDSALVANWLKTNWEQEFPQQKNIINTLLHYLPRVLSLPAQHWKLDSELIKRAQTILHEKPLADVGMTLLIVHTPHTETPIFQLTAPKGIQWQNSRVPTRYATNQTYTILHQTLPYIAEVVTKGDWVLGNRDDADPTIEINNLTEDLRTTYREHYEAAWLRALKQIQFESSDDFSTISNQLAELANPRSTLWHTVALSVLTPDSDQTATLSPNDTKPVTLAYNPLTQAIQNPALLHALTELKSIVDAITQSSTPTKMTYDQALLRFNATPSEEDPFQTALTLADNTPEPLKSWLTTTVQNAWHATRVGARHYLNTMWQNTILPEYEETVAARFPVFSDGQSDITPKAFSHFFGPSGTIESFFNFYLKPFIDTTQPYWTWKKIDGATLDISQDTLEMILRASLIQKMFYTNNTRAPAVHFVLTPIRYSPSLEEVTLNINGQMAHFKTEDAIHASFAWTSTENQDQFTTLQFDNAGLVKPTVTHTGPWAWLRLLKDATVKPTNNPSIFKVTFDIDGTQAIYKLTADSPINPYESEVLTQFRCPNQL